MTSKSTFIDKSANMEVHEDDCTSANGEWLLQDKLKLILKIKDSVPNKDNIPYDERARDIKWNNIKISSYSTTEIKETFNSILNNTRTYRMLSEVLKDAEKNLLSALDVKKPLSSFALFIHENKDQISSKNSQMNEPYTQTASNIFKSLTEEERKNYTSKYEKAKKDYKEELSKFQLEPKIEKKKSSKPSQTPTSPFIYFWREMKNSDDTANYINVRKEYTEMKPDEKLIWIFKFLGVKRGNLLTLEQFEKAASCLNKDELTLIDDYEQRPKKINAFNMFMKKYLKAAEHIQDRNGIFKSAVENWKKLKEEEKIRFKIQSLELKSEYSKKFDAFLESLPEDRRIYEQNKSKKNIPSKILNEKSSEGNTEVKNQKRKQSHTLNINVKEDDEITSNESTPNIKNEIYPEENTEVKKNKRKKSQTLNITEREEEPITSDESTQNKKNEIYPEDNTEVKKKKRKQSQTLNFTEREEEPITSDESTQNIKNEIYPEDNTEVKNKKRKQSQTLNISENEDSITSEPIQKNRNEKENTDNKNKKKLLRKLKLNENQENAEISKVAEPTGKSRKLSNDSITNNLIASEKSKNSEFDFKLVKPPGSLYKYFKLQVFKGPKEKSKSAFKALDKRQRKKLTEQYEKIKTKYLKKFEEHLVSLSAEDIELFAKQINESDTDDSISDVTDSD